MRALKLAAACMPVILLLVWIFYTTTAPHEHGEGMRNRQMIIK